MSLASRCPLNENKDEHHERLLRAIKLAGIGDSSRDNDPLWRLERLGTMLHWIFEHLAEVKIALKAGPHAAGSELLRAATPVLGERGATELGYLVNTVDQAQEHYDALARLLRSNPSQQPPGSAPFTE